MKRERTEVIDENTRGEGMLGRGSTVTVECGIHTYIFVPSC